MNLVSAAVSMTSPLAALATLRFEPDVRRAASRKRGRALRRTLAPRTPRNRS